MQLAACFQEQSSILFVFLLAMVGVFGESGCFVLEIEQILTGSFEAIAVFERVLSLRFLSLGIG
jgi:hypothetical protein